MIFAIITLTIMFLYVLLQIRYDFSVLPLYLITKLQKRNFKVAKTYEEIKNTLLLSDKGDGIEELIASPAWLPILSIESVNGPKWQELKRNFLIFQKYLPSVNSLGITADYEIKKFLKHSNEINAKDISILTLKIFINWIFKEEFKEENVLSDEMFERLYENSIEYRKEIAFKGEGCKKKKLECVQIIIDLLEKSEKYKNVFPDGWTKVENFSVVMQPFVISPMINVSDIAVSVHKNLDQYTKLEEIDAFIDYSILVSHPFPWLERFDRKTNTQIFINISEFSSSAVEPKFNYGYGPRSCLGRLYAREFLKKFFRPIIESKNVEFVPLKHHLYSGRDNDNANIKETLYQLKMLFKIFYKLIKKRIATDVKILGLN